MPPTSPPGQPDGTDNWFGTLPGQTLLESEHATIERALAERPALPWLWLAPEVQPLDIVGRGLKLAVRPGAGADAAYTGDIRCGLPLPLANESIGVVVVQHVARPDASGDALLAECARVLVPGGRLWLFALNPLAPYRWRWRGAGLRASEPLGWRRRLRRIGLAPEPVSQGIGPSWKLLVSEHPQDGPGLRAAYAVRADKRTLPLTPLRRRLPLRLPRSQGIPAAYRAAPPARRELSDA
ncbi:methyltransferase domain-containing protein [Luteimonas aquatica]|uniref:methyltransferase domain-containing protein n=1 Tax=Luteimonas aquatica TaxID=450364 RepID=UPI001F5796A2|nr:methyltransferase domain-containing protein [Luteimonas aquatica]